VQRDIQRNINYVKRIKNWCDRNNKGLYMLANSGCLYCCPGQIFHDNMVAHDAEIDEIKNIPDWTPHVCWNFYKKPENRFAVLQSSWIRPEDLHYYDGIFSVVKLATRMHSHPRIVIGAYVNRIFSGNLLDIFEPSFSVLFAPYYIDNTAFPEDFFKKISQCSRECEDCGYCKNTFKGVLKLY
ncbi:MAG: hypothetical protein PHV59_12340, partial [Victivallales bacterium]|nr:hypothetical protein [Victivallales bacterium]